MYEDIRAGKYKNKLAYPTAPKPICDHCGEKHKERQRFCGECGKELNFQSKIDTYMKQRKEYRKEESRLDDLFQSDLFDDLGISENPKKDKLFSMAYERGHSGGMEEVYAYASELVELIE